MSASGTQSGGTAPSAVQHIFVTIRGIAAHPRAIADADSPDWQELASHLAEQPIQVDLMARSADSRAPEPFAEGTLPADTFRQIRLRLVENQPAAGEPVPEENACGNVGFNCVVTADGSIRPLLLEGATPEMRIPSEQIAGNFFRLLPDTSVELDLRFLPHLSVVSPAGRGVRLFPVFTVAPRPASNPLDGSDR